MTPYLTIMHYISQHNSVSHNYDILFTMFLYSTIWDFISPTMISYLKIATLYFTVTLYLTTITQIYNIIYQNYNFIFHNEMVYFYKCIQYIYPNYDYTSQSAFIFNSLAVFIAIMTLYLAFATSYLITPTSFLTGVELWLHIPQMCLDPGSLVYNCQGHFTYPRLDT